MIDPKTLVMFSKQLEIDSFTIIREYLQIRFLQEFYKQKKLTETYFKGGTALRLIYQSPRFSEDLDFTTLLPIKTLHSLLQKTVASLQKEFPDLTIKPVKTIRGYSAKLYLPLTAVKQKVTVKLDFSVRESVVDPETSIISTLLPVVGIPYVEHLSDKEILAEKIRAITHRQKGRDFYDLLFLLNKQTPVDKGIVNKKLAFYKERIDTNNILSCIATLSERELDQDIHRFLPLGERTTIPHIKQLLLKELDKQLAKLT